MFWIDYSGALWQFTPVTASTWTSGTKYANTHWWSVELEGDASEPINDEQLVTARWLIAEWERYSDRTATRWPLEHEEGWRIGSAVLPTMLEHREVDEIEALHAGPTACPSDRYAMLWDSAGIFAEPQPPAPPEPVTLGELSDAVAELGHRLDQLAAALFATEPEIAGAEALVELAEVGHARANMVIEGVPGYTGLFACWAHRSLPHHGGAASASHVHEGPTGAHTHSLTINDQQIRLGGAAPSSVAED
jgi:hypothetical protein